jgi:hypothetical protein
VLTIRSLFVAVRRRKRGFFELIHLRGLDSRRSEIGVWVVISKRCAGAVGDDILDGQNTSSILGR